jgi:hypothetical protein
MVSHLVVGYSSDTSVYVEVDDEISSCLSIVGGRESSSVKARMHQISASALIVIVMRTHLWSAPIVAHFMSLALIALVAKIIFVDAFMANAYAKYGGTS